MPWIGCLEIGFVGALLGGLVKYLIGRLYGVFYGAVILVSLMAMFQPIMEGTSAAVSVVSLFVSAVMAHPGFTSQRGKPECGELLSSYIANTPLVFQGRIAQGGGLLGTLLVALLGFLFDYTGTYFIAVVLILMAVILAVHGTVSMRLKSAGEAVGASLDHRPTGKA